MKNKFRVFLHYLGIILDIFLLLFLTAGYTIFKILDGIIVFTSFVSWLLLLPFWIFLRIIRLLNMPKPMWLCSIFPVYKLEDLFNSASNKVGDFVEFHKQFIDFYKKG